MNLKVERAEMHLKALRKGVAKYRSAPEKTQRISSYDDSESGMCVVKCESLNDEALLRLGLIAGDFVCNLRSCLDHIICKLVVIAGHKISGDHCFPVVGQDLVDTQRRIVRSTYLREMYAFISKEVVPQFDRFFP